MSSTLPQQKISSPVGFGSLEDYVVNVLDIPHLPTQFQISDLNICDGVAKPPLYISSNLQESETPLSSLLQENLIQNCNDLVVYIQSLRLLNPDESFYVLMKALRFDKGELGGYIKKYEIHHCEDCHKDLYFPRPEGGKYNPYITYERSKISALRTYRMLSSLQSTCLPAFPEDCGEKDYNSVELLDSYVIEFTLTFPKPISNKFIAVGKDKERKALITRCLGLFMDDSRQLLLEIDGDKKEYGYSYNTHLWRTNPFDQRTGTFLEDDLKHLHLHGTLSCECWNDTKKTFEHFTPGIFIPKKVTTKVGESSIIPNLRVSIVDELHDLWDRIVNAEMASQGLNPQTTLDGDPVEIRTDLHFQIIPLRDRQKLIHSLKYKGRSVVVDIANWCNAGWITENTPKLKRSLFEIIDAGGLENQTIPMGWWRKTKTCVREHLMWDQTIIEQAIEDSDEVYLSDKADKLRFERIDEIFNSFLQGVADRSRICPLCRGDMEFVGAVDLSSFERDEFVKIELDKFGSIIKVWRDVPP